MDADFTLLPTAIHRPHLSSSLVYFFSCAHPLPRASLPHPLLEPPEIHPPDVSLKHDQPHGILGTPARALAPIRAASRHRCEPPPLAANHHRCERRELLLNLPRAAAPPRRAAAASRELLLAPPHAMAPRRQAALAPPCCSCRLPQLTPTDRPRDESGWRPSGSGWSAPFGRTTRFDPELYGIYLFESNSTHLKPQTKPGSNWLDPSQPSN